MRRLLVTATTALAVLAPAAHADEGLGADDPIVCVYGSPAGDACVWGPCAYNGNVQEYVTCVVNKLFHGVPEEPGR